MTYTAFKLNLDGSVSNKELLNNIGEVNAWLAAVYNKYARVRIIQNETGKVRDMADNGECLA